MICSSSNFRRAGLLFFCILSLLSLEAQSFVHRYKNNSGNQNFFAIRPLSDGRMIVGGGAATGNDRALAMLLDEDGNVVWSRLYGGQFGFAWVIADYAETADGQLLALVNVSDGNNTYTNLTRLSVQNGQVLSALRLGDDDRYAVYYNITPSNDGGFILSGAVGDIARPTGFSLLKTDANGSIIWQRSVTHPTLKGFLREAVVSENGDIWAVASLEDEFGAIGRIGLFHFSNTGDPLNAYQYTASDPLRRLGLYSIDWQPGIGPVVGGFYYNDGPTNTRPLIVQFDTTGSVAWSKVLNSPPATFNSVYIHRLSDGNLLAACGNGGASPLGVMAKLSPAGSILWVRNMTTNEAPESLAAASIDEQDNLFGAGIVFTPLPALERKGFVFKTDDPRFDEPSCCSQATTGIVSNAPLLKDTFNLTEGDLAEPNTTSFSSSAITQVRQDVCSSDDEPLVELSDTSICPGQCVTLSIVQPGGNDYILSVPGGIPESATVSDSITICFPEAGTYTIRLDDGDCSRTALTIEVEQLAPGAFTLSDTLICPGRCITLSASVTGNPDDYIWVFDGAQPDTVAGLSPPEVCFDTAGIYSLRLYLIGCGFNEQTLEVSARPFRIPDAFSPDGDQINDTFRPLLDCPDGEYSFEIYNRWGEKIFATNDPNAGWDGTQNNVAAPVDVYVWVLRFGTLQNGGQALRQSEHGQVTLLR
ncbi:MAG: gliding motility-associated C-terminal domain-containing protein [Saprospiraceae bacterium]|nr:gliding motility-associated C-terminal domain-containing protein [Saprospiraceae bacterium]